VQNTFYHTKQITIHRSELIAFQNFVLPIPNRILSQNDTSDITRLLFSMIYSHFALF